MFQCRPAPSHCLMRSLIRSLADSGKRAVEMFSAYSKMERLAFRMERKLHRETRTPIANCKMKPNTEPIVQRQPAIHRLRQQIRHVLARRSVLLDPCNYPRGQPVESDRSLIYLVARRRRTLILFYV